MPSISKHTHKFQNAHRRSGFHSPRPAAFSIASLKKRDWNPTSAGCWEKLDFNPEYSVSCIVLSMSTSGSLSTGTSVGWNSDLQPSIDQIKCQRLMQPFLNVLVAKFLVEHAEKNTTFVVVVTIYWNWEKPLKAQNQWNQSTAFWRLRRVIFQTTSYSNSQREHTQRLFHLDDRKLVKYLIQFSVRSSEKTLFRGIPLFRGIDKKRWLNSHVSIHFPYLMITKESSWGQNNNQSIGGDCCKRCIINTSLWKGIHSCCKRCIINTSL